MPEITAIKPSNEKPDKEHTDKLKAFITAKGAKSSDVTFLDKAYKDRKEMADDLREWCKSLPKAK